MSVPLFVPPAARKLARRLSFRGEIVDCPGDTQFVAGGGGSCMGSLGTLSPRSAARVRHGYRADG